MPFNFMGQVCLTNSLLFGVAASVIAWWVYPMLERAIARVRPATMNIVFVVVVIAGGILFSLYAIAPPEGIDLGQTSTQVAEMKIESERLDIKIESESVIDSLDDLRKEIEKSKYVSDEDRKDLLERVDKLTNESKELDEKVESLSASADKPADKTAQDQTSSTDQAATSEKSEETASSEGEGQQSEEAPENVLAEAA
jgi:predicted PurR-regulated permease PerM